MLPLLAVNVLVVLIPSLSAVGYSFTDWTGIGDATFIGWSNYSTLFGDSAFLNALGHNIFWTAFFLIVPMTMGLFGAYALTRVRRFKLIFRVTFFVPYIVASVVTASIWRSLLSPDTGIGRFVAVNFLGDSALALPSVAFINNWAWWGFLVVVFLAAMQGINPSLYEAAAMDGAGPTRQFFSITLPGIRPTFAFLGLMTIIWSFLSFDYVYILTQGGPAGSTDVLSTLLYRNAFGNLQAGYASAIGVVMALISGVVVAAYLIIRKVRNWEI
ncbi:carbohydrate ABC transporter permease [Frigoribacterium sp. PhB24]|uniref:carbohydrate ABC transporter permease n=1 Tax=Frigoribacterium sp. PhB24 TaxID=2485204 RepID=UPI000F47C882|nr:sugar ABC transporter permease [Frigoribacterium sp. PhB24]ROS48866.1 carbohydrate ABC transporter membrane protein 1 (CUT1 family) [Frigoribacterium sp. PhB24]